MWPSRSSGSYPIAASNGWCTASDRSGSFRGRFCSREPFGVLIPLASHVRHPFPAQERRVTLHARRHRALCEITIYLAVALAVENRCAQTFNIKVRGDRRQPFICYRRYHHVSLRSIERLAQADVIDVVIF